MGRRVCKVRSVERHSSLPASHVLAPPTPSTTTLQRLSKCGADVNLQGGKHGTALSAACSWDYPEAVELLLNHGANIHLQDYAAWYSVTRRIASQGGKSTGFETSPMSGTVMLEPLLNRGMDINHEYAEFLHCPARYNDCGTSRRKLV